MQKIFKTELVEEYLKENNLSKTKFCKLCKISYNQFNKFMNQQRNFYFIVFFRIARVLNLEAYELCY